MNVVYYYHTSTPEDPFQRITSAISVRSVKKAMPKACVIHLRDSPKTYPLWGVDHVCDVQENGRVSASMAFDMPGLFIDTDMVVLEDLEKVIPECDLAVVEWSGHRPYNGGFIWTTNPKQFYREVEERFKDDIEDAFCLAVKETSLKKVVLPERYNFIPKNKQESTEDAAVIHYKGNRKAWMIERHL